MEPARLFVVGNHEIKSREDAIQGYLTAMGAYALIHFLSEFILINEPRSKKVAFAGDFAVAGKASEIKVFLGYITTTRTFVALLPQTIQIISDCERTAVDVFMGSKVKLTLEEK